MIGWLALATGAAAVLLSARSLTPSSSGHGTHLQLGLPPCSFLVWTGLPCPTCGLTTAFALLAHGEQLASLRAHPLGLPLFLVCAAALALALCGIVRRWSLLATIERLHADRWALLLVSALLLSWLARLSALALGLVSTGEVELLQLADQVAAAHA